ncbi:MAG: hypothetical protein RIS29_3221, partial [Bacteroidota bacterium]
MIYDVDARFQLFGCLTADHLLSNDSSINAIYVGG